MDISVRGGGGGESSRNGSGGGWRDGRWDGRDRWLEVGLEGVLEGERGKEVPPGMAVSLTLSYTYTYSTAFSI